MHPLYLSPNIHAFLAYTLNPKKIEARSEPLDPIYTRVSGDQSCFHCISTYRSLYFICRLIVNNNSKNINFNAKRIYLHELETNQKTIFMQVDSLSSPLYFTWDLLIVGASTVHSSFLGGRGSQVPSLCRTISCSSAGNRSLLIHSSIH